jgi:pimeloyl-ACP methyl ester carboxylesterase
MADSQDDMNFTAPSLSRISTSTLIVYGDRDFLYPIEMAVDLYRAIPRSALWVVPNGGHGPCSSTPHPILPRLPWPSCAPSGHH